MVTGLQVVQLVRTPITYFRMTFCPFDIMHEISHLEEFYLLAISQHLKLTIHSFPVTCFHENNTPDEGFFK
jgi:hypothetical protein